MNNSSIATADRLTHLKIVAVSLVAAIAVVVVGIMARPTIGDGVTARLKAEAPILQAGKTMTLTRSDASAVR
jgi:heme exporter protein D